MSKLFVTLCSLLDVKHHGTTAYRLHTNCEVERFNKAVVSQLGHFVAEHRHDWDAFVKLLTYAYNTQVQLSTNRAPHSLVLAR